AALYAQTAGEWPARLELVPLQGKAVEVPFDPTDCAALLAAAIADLERVNAAIEAASQHSEAETQLARPSAAACRHCPFRPACRAYQAARVSAGNDGEWPQDVWGEVREMRRLGNGRLLLSVSAPNAQEPRHIRGLTPDHARHPALKELRE